MPEAVFAPSRGGNCKVCVILCKVPETVFVQCWRLSLQNVQYVSLCELFCAKRLRQSLQSISLSLQSISMSLKIIILSLQSISLSLQSLSCKVYRGLFKYIAVFAKCPWLLSQNEYFSCRKMANQAKDGNRSPEARHKWTSAFRVVQSLHRFSQPIRAAQVSGRRLAHAAHVRSRMSRMR
jgi:hypothetical protein